MEGQSRFFAGGAVCMIYLSVQRIEKEKYG